MQLWLCILRILQPLKRKRIKAQEEQPVWGMIQIDNIEELTKGPAIENIQIYGRKSTISSLMKSINTKVSFGTSKMICTHLPFLRGALQDMENNGFSVLERIRKLPFSSSVPATISIGIGENAGSVKDVSERARAAPRYCL